MRQCSKILEKSIADLNEHLLGTLNAFVDFGVTPPTTSLGRSLSQIERVHSQLSSGGRGNSDQIMQPEGSALQREVLTSEAEQQSLGKEEEEQVKGLLLQFKADAAPLTHILTLYNNFYVKFKEEKNKLTEKSEEVAKSIAKTDEKKELTEEDQKTLADLKKEAEVLGSLKLQKEGFLADINQFFKNNGSIRLLVEQCNQLLATIQTINVDMISECKPIINCVFECFIPEMQEEVITAAKDRAKNAGKLSKEENADSKYVQMEPIAKAQPEAEMELDLAKGKQLSEPLNSSAPKKSKKQNLIFRDIDEASERLVQFSVFCVHNKTMLNKLVRNIFNASSRERESSQQDIGTVAEFIKFMPNLLDFENKRMYFKKEIKKIRRSSYSRDLTLYIRRSEIFMDAYSQLNPLQPGELKGKMTVEFTGERGQDVGGLTRDFFIELSKEMFNPNYSLFKRSDNGSNYMPNPKSYVQTDHIRYFKFIGRCIGKALFEGCLLECYFVRSIYKMMIGQKLSFQDLEDFDNNLYVGLNWCLQKTSNVEELYETFGTTQDYFGRTEVIDLVPGGRDIDVTNDNKEYYVERKAYFHLYKSVQQQMDAFLDGFYEIIPKDLIQIFTYKELELLISGLPDFKGK